MTLYQFNAADEMEQIEAFWDGALVGRIEKEGFLYECRQIDDFYVEYKIKDRQYIKFKSFRNPELLQPYLDSWGQMDLDG
jgi:hypothetical protein